MLRAHSQVLSDAVHVGSDVMSADERRARRRREQSCQDGPAEETEHRLGIISAR